MSQPFDYPEQLLVRRLAPRGNEQAASFRPWLRDEFAFRCMYCLIRETWRPDLLEVEHFIPETLAADRALDYDNLLYDCRLCNGKKRSQSVPDPGLFLTRRTGRSVPKRTSPSPCLIPVCS